MKVKQTYSLNGVEVTINKKLTKEQKKALKEQRKAEKKAKKGENNNSKIVKTVCATTLVIAIGVGTAVGLKSCSFFKGDKKDKAPSKPTTTSSAGLEAGTETKQVKEGFRFDPNSKQSVIDNAVFLIEEAARCGKELDAEDAVLATIVANSNELNLGFVGQLFGEPEQQTYTYGSIIDAYLRTCIIQSETVGIAKDDTLAFNMENTFSSNEDYNFLCNLRELTTRYNNAKTEEEKSEITNELNTIAADLCGYDVYDISSPAGIIAMLTLDGMRTVTITNDNPILHDDIRDEMFGNGDYLCQTEGTYTNEEGLSRQTAYSNRVSDLKLDTLKNKLDDAILGEGKTIILPEIIAEVETLTANVEIADINLADKINEIAEENRTITYEYEEEPGVEKDGWSKKNPDDEVKVVDGEEVVVVPGDKKPSKPSNPSKPSTPSQPAPTESPTAPTAPIIKEEDNVKPKPGENVEPDKEDAEEELENEWEKAQKDSEQGGKDGKADGQAGKKKRSLSGKSEYYINAYNTNYDFYYNLYLDAQQSAKEQASETKKIEETTPKTEEKKVEEVKVEETTVAEVSLDNLSKEQLNELKAAALGDETSLNEDFQKTM